MFEKKNFPIKLIFHSQKKKKENQQPQSKRENSKGKKRWKFSVDIFFPFFFFLPSDIDYSHFPLSLFLYLSSSFSVSLPLALSTFPLHWHSPTFSFPSTASKLLIFYCFFTLNQKTMMRRGRRGQARAPSKTNKAFGKAREFNDTIKGGGRELFMTINPVTINQSITGKGTWERERESKPSEWERKAVWRWERWINHHPSRFKVRFWKPLTNRFNCRCGVCCEA